MKPKASGNDSTDDETTPLQKKRSAVARNKQKQSTSAKKYVVLALCCGNMAAMYFILAQPAALHRQLRATMPSDTPDAFEMNFNMLFTVSYFPNMILPVFGGKIVDKYGGAKCLVGFCLIVFLGQCFTASGCSRASWRLMLAGRLIFGLGAQNLIVANASLVSKWFAGNEGVALGLSNVCSYAGVISTNMASPFIANTFRPSTAFWTGVALESIAIILASVVLWLDRKKKVPNESMAVCSPMFSPIAVRRVNLVTQSAVATEYANISISMSPGIVTLSTSKRFTSDERVLKNVKHFKPTFWLLCASFLLVYGVVWSFTNVSSAILLERDFFLKPAPDCVLDIPGRCSSGLLAPEKGNSAHNSKGQLCPIGNNVAPVIPLSINESEHIFETLSSSDIKCHNEFWSEACTADYCKAQTQATQRAGFWMSVPYFFVVLLTYHLGLFVDSTGYRTELICFGSLLLVVAHGLLTNPRLSPPVVPLVAQGLGYTICVAALWPSVPFTVSEDSVGAAFGIMMAVQNFGLALIPLLVAYLYKLGHNKYLPIVELFFAGGSFMAVLVGVALMTADKKTDLILSTPKPNIRFSEKEGMVAIQKRHGRTISDADVIYVGLHSR